MAEALFAAAPGTIAGPVRVDGTSRVFRVLAQRPAELDRATRERIERELFDDWLARQRRSARIEWNWGRHSESDADARMRPYH